MERKLHVGWSTRDITPPQPVMLQGQMYVRVSQEVHDPISVTALAIEGGERDGAIMVSCDLTGIPTSLQDSVRHILTEQALGLAPEKVFLNATHTHTAPVIEEGIYETPDEEVMSPTEYSAFLAQRIAEAAREAWERREPGCVSWAYGHAVVGHNRRAVYADGTAKMYGKTDRQDFECIEGYEDHSVDMLFTWNERKELSGIVLNIPCPSQVDEHQRFISADYWHEVRAELRARYESGLFVLPQCGPAGDQSPHFLLYKREEEYMRGRAEVSERQGIALRVAAAVKRALEGARADIRTRAAFGHRVRHLDLTPRRISAEECQRAREALESIHDEKGRHRRSARLREAIERFERRDQTAPFGMELHVLRIGEIALATNPFELYLDFGLRVKARSKALQTFLVQLCAGRGSYLPTFRAVKSGSYGAQPMENRVGPEGGQKLVEHTLEEIAALWG